MKTRFIALVIAVLGLSSTGALSITVKGSPTCSEWLNEKGSVDGAANQAWLLGYLSGLAEGVERDFVRGTDSKSIYLSIDTYCRKSPSSQVSKGAWDLARSLAGQRQQ